MSGQDTAMGLLSRLNAQLVRRQFRLALQPGRPQVSLAEHWRSSTRSATGDERRAELAACAHLVSVIGALKAVETWGWGGR
jgi:hypothetical protein